MPSRLHVNHLGGRIDDGRMLKSHPDRSMFLLSRGPLGEDYHGHQGWVWQCQNCGSANTKRGNVMRMKCKSRSGLHKLFFDNQPDKLSEDGEPAILSPIQVSTSLSLAIAIVAFSLFTYSAFFRLPRKPNQALAVSIWDTRRQSWFVL